MPKKKKSKNKKNKILKVLLKMFLFAILLGILVMAGLFIGLYYSIANGAGALSKEDYEINKFTTIIYDKNGDEYTRISGGENRTYATLDQISPYLPKAFISIEDERFETHFGIDVKRTAGATVKYALSKVGIGSSSYGGSTITQQVVKKVTGEEDRTATRKIKEIIRAIQLEKQLSKNQIIELYMNLIYLGEGAYGVQTAAHTYFDKDASELTIAECALIAGLAQAPEGKNPYNYPEKAKARQELVLLKMHELGYITDEQYTEALNQELVYTKGTLELVSSNSYFVDAVIENVIADLQETKGVTRVMAEKMIYNDGLKIYTTVDPDIQATMEKVFADDSYFQHKNGEYDEDLQAAMVVIDYKKGNVVGLVGGAGEKTRLRGLNRATQITRAPGSNIKPLAVYGAGLENGTLTAATVFDDVPVAYKIGNTVWSPNNYDSRYRGLSNIRKGIEISMNIVAVKAFYQVNAIDSDYSYEFLKNLGITTLTSNDRYPAALSLGGLTNGVSPLELAAAYGTIANSGIYIEPKLYTKVINRTGETILENKSEVRDVMSKENAFILTDMMTEVTTGSEGTALSAKIKNIDTAGKTGTTSDTKDRWFTAYTPYYVGSVWVGYDVQKELSTKGNPSAKLWKAVMEEVHKDLAPAKFEKPDGVVEVEVCMDSGLLPTEACRNDKRGSRVYTEYFNSKNGTIPTEYCSTHVYYEVCPDSFKLANPMCKHLVGTIKIVRLNRHYEDGEPTKLPEDYAYEIPSTYCDFEDHYCPVDENGDWITNFYTSSTEDDDYDDDIESLSSKRHRNRN